MDYDKLMKNDPVALVKRMLSELGAKKAVDVRYEFERKDHWAVVSIYMDDQDNELALRLHAGGSYELYIGYYDEEDELQELSHTLTDEQVKAIPANLRKVMTKVVADEEGLRVPGNVLTG